MSAAQPLRNRIAALALAAAAGLAPRPAAADDTALFSTAYPPNVLLFVDNSGSMNTIMYHPAFVIDDYPFSCDIITAADYGTGGYFNLADDNGDNVKRYAGDGPAESSIDIGKTDSGFVSTPTTGHADNGYITRTFCGQTRRLYVDGRQWQLGNRTWYQEEYIEWYFSLDPSDTATTYGPAAQTAAQIITEIEDSANGRKFIDGAYFGKYQRTRIAAARDIADDVIYQTNTDCPAYGGDCGVYYDRVRFGLAQFQRFSEGGFVRVGIDAYSVNKANLESAIDALDARTVFLPEVQFLELGVDGHEGAADPAIESLGAGTHLHVVSSRSRPAPRAARRRRYCRRGRISGSRRRGCRIARPLS